MITRPVGRNDKAARPGQEIEENAHVSVQRCVPVAGPERLPPAPRLGARTQLGMPALSVPGAEPAARERPPSSAGVMSRDAGSVSVRPRRLPPPLPARFAAPKVVVAPASRLLDTRPAQRLLLAPDATELAGVETLAPLSVPARGWPREAETTRTARPALGVSRGVRRVLVKLLVRLLGLLAPSLQLQAGSRPAGSSRGSQRG